MCNRFFQEHQSAKVAEKYRASIGESMSTEGSEVLKDIYPQYRAVIVRVDQTGERKLEQMYWAFIPPWVKDADMKKFTKPNNARDDTIIKSLHEKKGMFYAAMLKTRCIIPLSGWCEYTGDKGAKVANRLSIEGKEIVSVAGLYTYRANFPGLSCTMITTEATGKAAEYHNRIPVVLLTEEDEEAWLDPKSDPMDLAVRLFKCVPDDLLKVEIRPEDQLKYKSRKGEDELFDI